MNARSLTTKRPWLGAAIVAGGGACVAGFFAGEWFGVVMANWLAWLSETLGLGWGAWNRQTLTSTVPPMLAGLVGLMGVLCLIAGSLLICLRFDDGGPDSRPPHPQPGAHVRVDRLVGPW